MLCITDWQAFPPTPDRPGIERRIGDAVRVPLKRSLAAQVKGPLPVTGQSLQQRMTGLPSKSGKIILRGRVGGANFQHLAAVHRGQRFFGSQNRHRALETTHIELMIGST